MKHTKNLRSSSGFTLAEILLAMMVFAIAITTILALLARSIETADSIIIKDEAIGLSSAVDEYLSELPFYDATEPSTYRAVQTGNAVVFAYKYRANPAGTPRADGTLPPYPTVGADDNLGQEYVVVSGVRPLGDPELGNDIAASESRLFRVELRVSEANPFTGPLPADPNADSDSDGFPNYDQAVLVLFAEFYQVPNTTFVPDTTSVNPVFSFNFAVRR